MHNSLKLGFPLAALILLGLSSAQPAKADSTIYGDTADRSIGDGNTTKPDLTTGAYYTDYQLEAAFVFQLPTLLPGQTFTSANFNTFVDSTTAITGDPLYFNIGVEGLNARPTSTVSNSDYYFDGSSTGTAGTLIQSSFVPSGATATGTYTTSSAGSANLTSYLNAQAAANPGAYVFLRLTPSSDPSTTPSGVNFASADNSNVLERPIITYTLSDVAAAPEPSQMAGMAFTVLGIGSLLLRARKRTVAAAQA